MLSVKLVRSLVLGEAIINNPCLPHDNNDNVGHSNSSSHEEYDADDDDNTHLQIPIINPKIKKKKKMPLLLFTKTKELVSDTFRLAKIARDIGMDFYPSPSLSHLLFSWPSSSSLSSFLPSPPFSSSSSNNRPSVSSNTTMTTTTTSTSTSSTFSLWGGTIPNDAVPLPFPSLSTSSSISLLRYFVSLSKGLFKLVFVEIDDSSRFNSYNYDCSSNFALVSRVSGKVVNSMEELSRVLAGNGWELYRSSENKQMAVALSSQSSSSVFMFRKKDSNRVRVKKMMINGGGGVGGECRMRELRLPSLDFKNGVPLRILQYILLMTDDVFYLAEL
ncbi:unnamed protein product [Amaranthus hypochondriacus]